MKQATRLSGSVSLVIRADAARIWSLIADVTRMGEWSPECVGGEWIDGAEGPAAGARFRGRNRLGPFRWATLCTIETCEPGTTFSFTARHRSRALTRWSYRLEPTDGGTRVTESYEALFTPRWIDMIERAVGRDRMLERGMAGTIERLRAAAERTA